MKITIKPTDISKIAADVLVTFTFEKEGFPQIVEKGLLESLKRSAQRESFNGKVGEFFMVNPQDSAITHKIAVFGAGDESKFTELDIRDLVASAISKIKPLRPNSIGIVVPETWMKKSSPERTVESIVESVLIASYHFLTYKSEEFKNDHKEIGEVYILVSPSKLTMAEKGLNKARIVGEATNFARDLVNEPPQVTTPTHLAGVAIDITKKSSGLIKTTIYEKTEIAKMGMNAFLGVAQGSEEAPKFIHLIYKGKSAKKKIVVIGKGITFDTGGLSLKPAEHMETMKLDMAGAAAVLGLFKALTILKPNITVVGLIAACENMPSGKAMRPGDILRAMNGKTIEVLNTDAEGRLTLADMLSFAVEREKPDAMIDLATLTGACMVALGNDYAGLFGNEEKLVEDIKKSATNSGEKLWQLPLPKDYKNLIKSPIADLKNIQTGRYGGAVTAALFLEEFVGSTPWVHLDIAGPSFSESNNPMYAHGGTGYGVRLLIEYITNI